jgi:hypothetical protein
MQVGQYVIPAPNAEIDSVPMLQLCYGTYLAAKGVSISIGCYYHWHGIGSI